MARARQLLQFGDSGVRPPFAEVRPADGLQRVVRRRDAGSHAASPAAATGSLGPG